MSEFRGPRPGDVASALALLTRLPVPADHMRGAGAAWAWPLAGAVIGLLQALAAGLALWLGLGPVLAAGLALGAGAVLTGALHEDGLADMFDGLWGGRERARRLEIMRDSRIGSYGVLALVLCTGLRWTALAQLLAAGWLWAPLLAAGALGRAAMTLLAHLVPAARTDGASAGTGRPDRQGALIAGALALLLALLLAGGAGLVAALAAAVAGWAVARIALAKIGGQTGDILGASQVLAEIAALMALAAMLG